MNIAYSRCLCFMSVIFHFATSPQYPPSLHFSLSLSLSYVPLPDLLLCIILLQPFQQFFLVVQIGLSNASHHTRVLTGGSKSKSREGLAVPSKTNPENQSYSSLFITTHQSLVMLPYLTPNRT